MSCFTETTKATVSTLIGLFPDAVQCFYISCLTHGFRIRLAEHMPYESESVLVLATVRLVVGMLLRSRMLQQFEIQQTTSGSVRVGREGALEGTKTAFHNSLTGELRIVIDFCESEFATSRHGAS